MRVPNHPPIRLRRRRASVLPPLMVLAAAAGAALWMAGSSHDGPDDPASAIALVTQAPVPGGLPGASPRPDPAPAANGAQGNPAASPQGMPLYGSLAALDRALARGPAPRPLASSGPLPAGLHQEPMIASDPGPLPGPAYTVPAQEPIDAAVAAEAARPDVPATTEAALPAQRPDTLDGEAGEDAAIAAASAGPVAPLPPPRPAWLAAPAEPAPSAQAALAPQAAPPARRARLAQPAAPVVATDNRTFLQKLFGGGAAQGEALAYAAPQDDAAPRAGVSRLLTSPADGADAMTAVYDISARTVYMPNGEKLEAHSGLGEHMDDPRSVHVRMKGATPPHLYELREREALFHGVRAIRLNPVGGSGAIHGRAGLLAHTFMLGPRGDSNGCVSFRDYDRFLQAYLRGEVKRLLVVAGRG